MFTAPMRHFIKRQGFKVLLPLLLLATACDRDNAATPSSGDGGTSAADTTGVTAPPNPNQLANSVGSGTAPANPSTGPAGNGGNTPVTRVAAVVTTTSTTPAQKVPEPASLAGLTLVAAIGIGTLKRRQKA